MPAIIPYGRVVLWVRRGEAVEQPKKTTEGSRDAAKRFRSSKSRHG